MLRTIGLLLATLLVGAVLGAAIVGNVARARFAASREFLTADGFQREVLRLIQADETPSTDAVHEIVGRHGQSIDKVVRASRAEFLRTFDQMVEDLGPHLDPQQMEQLKERSRRIRARIEQTTPPPGLRRP